MTVRELFASLRGSEVALLPNPGNCGDGLIRLGLFALCREFDVRFVELRVPCPASGKVLLVPAAGNLCGSYHGIPELLAPYIESFAHIYLLPCSVDVSEPSVEHFLRVLPPNVTLFTREPYSYAQARFAIADDARVHLDHDLAFSFDYTPWSGEGAGVLNAYRDDPESGGRPIPPGNLDLSAFGSTGDGEMLPRLLQHVREVHTDRAHVAICASMLGKETHIYPNNYHKVRGIYEYSLRDMLNVHFHGFDELYAEETA